MIADMATVNEVDPVGGGVALNLIRLATPAAAAWADRGLIDPAVRAALLIDLALCGALVDEPGGLAIDTSPTGFDPTDRVLAAIVDQPDRPLQWWLYHAPVRFHDLAEILVARHIWQHHGALRRYRDVDPHATAAELKRVRAASRGQQCPPDKLVLATLLDVVTPPNIARNDTQYGSADWLVPDLVDHLVARAKQLQAAARYTQNTLIVQDIY